MSGWKDNWGLQAVVFTALAGWQIYSIATATEAPSQTLMILQYALVAGCLIGLGNALYRLMAR